jgi:hypothetical protein
MDVLDIFDVMDVIKVQQWAFWQVEKDVRPIKKLQGRDAEIMLQFILQHILAPIAGKATQ